MVIFRVSRLFIWGVMLWCGVATALAEPQTGPVVPSFGPVLPPPEGAYSLDADTHYKVSIDVGETAEFPGDQSRKLTSVARFLNMHAQQGMSAQNIEFAVIVHGMAANDLLTDEAYEGRFNSPNPNTALLDELNRAGVTVYLCSQTAAFRQMAPEEFREDVVMALSAMSAHVRLQQEGFTLIPF
jgi:intracellular sulfur oxidation DsrE/DsrF family protein